LADELFKPRFQHITEKYRQVKPVIPRLLSGSVEQKLQALSQEADHFPERLKQLAAVKFYLHDVIWECDTKWKGLSHGITNYVGLLDEVERWRWALVKKGTPVEGILLVTFNYDTLLEEAVGKYPVEIKIDAINKYISNFYKVIKPHGSINWAHEVNVSLEDLFELSEAGHLLQEDVAGELIERINELIVQPSVSMADEYPTTWWQGSGFSRVLFPALSIPVESKSQYECPENHIKELTKHLPHVNNVITIGWRATELEFLKLLAAETSSEVKAIIVSSGKESAERQITRMQKTGIRWEFLPSDANGFSHFVGGSHATKFLNQTSGLQ
jgi:hypothetical protein